MRQYTTPEQTAKLIELGFERPRCLHNCELAYNIGELIEMLPSTLNINDITRYLNITFDPRVGANTWWVSYIASHSVECKELIDALYDMVVKLKADGVI